MDSSELREGVHKELVGLLDFKELLEEAGNRQSVKEFSWDVGYKLFEKVMGSKQKSDMYFLNGNCITDEEYLDNVTTQICEEYGLSLLDITADLMLPVGYGYPSLVTAMPHILEDAAKPVSKVGNTKTIIWIEDELWKDSSTSIVEPLVCKLLLSRLEPILIAPLKYFDKEVFAAISKTFQHSQNTKEESDGKESCTELETSWYTLSVLIRFGFLLALRSVNASPIILLHFSQILAEKVNAFELLDLAKAEGHQVKFLKNIQGFTPDQRISAVNNLVEKLVSDLNARKFGKGGAVGNEFVIGKPETDENENEILVEESNKTSDNDNSVASSIIDCSE